MGSWAVGRNPVSLLIGRGCEWVCQALNTDADVDWKPELQWNLPCALNTLPHSRTYVYKLHLDRNRNAEKDRPSSDHRTTLKLQIVQEVGN